MSSVENRSARSLFKDTIYAVATAAGKSGVAVIRISGPQALAAAQALTGRPSFTPRMAHFVTFRSAAQEVLDTGLALYFKAPRSFTGEDVVECHMHGSMAGVRDTLEALSQIEGLRPAEAGEFTRRAFAYGKMDLTEAEGLADLIEAETHQQKAQALRQMGGALSKYYDQLRDGIIRILAHLEAYIDFPDEEIPESVLTGLSGEIKGLQGDIRTALDDDRRGERLRNGITIVILGAPNVGKSSLLNTIARRDVAIVSYKAGTTRDAIEIHLDMAGYPVVLVDTAGIRESDEEIEAEGIRRALARAEAAEIRLVLFDGERWPAKDAASAALLGGNAIAVVSKCDMLGRKEREEGILYLSTKTGEGVEALLSAIEERITGYFSRREAPFITRERHRALLCEALTFLDNSLADQELELRCEELRLAAQAIGKITGKIQVDDVLDVIFKRFCIGK